MSREKSDVGCGMWDVGCGMWDILAIVVEFTTV